MLNTCMLCCMLQRNKMYWYSVVHETQHHKGCGSHEAQYIKQETQLLVFCDYASHSMSHLIHASHSMSNLINASHSMSHLIQYPSCTNTTNLQLIYLVCLYIYRFFNVSLCLGTTHPLFIENHKCDIQKQMSRLNRQSGLVFQKYFQTDQKQFTGIKV